MYLEPIFAVKIKMHESEIPSLYCFLPSSPSSLSSPYSVRPENLQNLHTTDGKNYSWNYPDSWEKPCSFFSLHFQVKVVHNEDTCHSDKHIRVIRTSASSYTSLQCKKKSMFVFNMSPLLLHSSTKLTTRSLRSTSKPRGISSACELRTSTPEDRLDPGATARK